MMAEAQKMMDNPAFQKQMKNLSGDKEFNSALKNSVDAMKDPSKQAEMEAKLEHMMKVGDAELKNAAGNVMQDAMAAMANPEVMAEMTKMISNPNFQEQLAAMSKDPNFKLYMESVSVMKQFFDSIYLFLHGTKLIRPCLFYSTDARHDEGPTKEG